MRSHRYRRNFELTPPPVRPEVSRPESIARLTMVGIVVNPKTCEPLISFTDGDYQSIRSLHVDTLLEKVGRGFHSTGHESASVATGYPRVHTPEGVTEKGGGYGTALYTALCLGAHLVDEDLIEISMSTKGGGICSAEEDRSHAASHWWNASRRRGLTKEQIEEETEEEREENVELAVDPDDLERCIGRNVDGKIVYVNSVSVDIERETTTEKIFNYYTWDSAENHHLVVCGAPILEFSNLRGIWQHVLEAPDSLVDLDRTALLALDVRGLDPDALNLIELCYLAAGLTEADVDSLRYRWQHDLDVGEVSPQLRLFRPNAETRAAGLERVAEARRASGWSDLADLP